MQIKTTVKKRERKNLHCILIRLVKIQKFGTMFIRWQQALPGGRVNNSSWGQYRNVCQKPSHLTWASLLAQTVKNLPAMRETWFDPWVGKIPWRREWQPTPIFLPRESHGQRSLVGHRDCRVRHHWATKHSTGMNCYYRLNYSLPPPIICWNPSPQCDWIWT